MAFTEHDGINRESRTYDEALVQLLQSIAKEEESISKLIRTESDKAMAFVGKKLDFPTNPSTSEIIRYNQSLIHLLDSVLMSKWLLMKKLDMVLLHRTDSQTIQLDEDELTIHELDDQEIDY